MATPANGGPDPISEEEFRFVMPGRLEYREAARAFLSFVCERLSHRSGLSQDVGYRVISAFVEAYNNAVIHAYKGEREGPVEVELSVRPDRLRLRIIDEGAGFTPAAVPEPDLDALPEGGMGLFIMRSFMDNVEYTRDGDRNVLVMDKALEPRGDA